MIVTGDRDPYIADYAISSYSKLKNVDFKLLVYSNYIPKVLKDRYFPTWRRYEYVELVENAHHDGKTPEKAEGYRGLQGPFERGSTIWDRELPKIDTEYVAAVDADFEILKPDFIYDLLNASENVANIAGASSDHSETSYNTFERYSKTYVNLHERWHTWFIIYRKKVIDCGFSLEAHYEKNDQITDIWDDHAYFQKHLIDRYGYKFYSSPQEYRDNFIHYGAFAKNIDITDKSIAFYRMLKIIGKNGLWGMTFPRFLALLLGSIFFGEKEKRRGQTHKDFKRF